MNNASQKTKNKDNNTVDAYLPDQEVLSSFKKLERFIKNLDKNKNSFYTKEEILVALKKLEKIASQGLVKVNPKILNKKVEDKDFLDSLEEIVKIANFDKDKANNESGKKVEEVKSNENSDTKKLDKSENKEEIKEEEKPKEKMVKLVENEKLEIAKPKEDNKKETKLEDLFRIDTFSPGASVTTNNKAQKAIENLLGDDLLSDDKDKISKPSSDKKQKDQIKSLGETLTKNKKSIVPFLKKHEPEKTERLYDKKGNFNYYKYFQADEGEESLKYCSSSIKKLADPNFNKSTKAGIIENLKKEKERLEKQIDSLISIEPTGDIYIVTDKKREKAFDGETNKVVLEYKEGLGDKIAKKIEDEEKAPLDDKYNETMLNTSTDLSIEASEWIARNYPADKTLSLKSLRTLTDKTVAENINKFEGKTIDFSGVTNFSEEALEIFRSRQGYMMLSGLEPENLTDEKLKILKAFKSKCFFSDPVQAKIDNF